MKNISYLLFILVLCFACNPTSGDGSENVDAKSKTEIEFDKTKWSVKEGSDYPYRDQMLNDIVYNDTVRTLSKDEIIKLLGEPDRTNEGHLYYMITQKRLFSHPLHTKTMVIKLTNDSTIAWIKIHQ